MGLNFKCNAKRSAWGSGKFRATGRERNNFLIPFGLDLDTSASLQRCLWLFFQPKNKCFLRSYLILCSMKEYLETSDTAGFFAVISVSH